MDSLDRVLSIETPTLLENERGKRFNFEAILQVFLAEALHHKTLFSLSLQPKGKPAGKTTYPTSLERPAEHPQQDAAVDGSVQSE